MPNCGRNGFKLLARKPHLSGDYTVKFETAYDSNGKVNVHQMTKEASQGGLTVIG